MKPATATPGHPAAIPTPEAPARTHAHPARRSAAKPALIAVAAAAALFWGTRFGWHTYHYVETDNAYVTGHLHQVSPQLDGQVKEVLVIDNQEVKAGDVLVRLDPLEFEIGAQKAVAALAQAKAQESQAAAVAAQAAAQLAEATARVSQAEAGTGQTRAQLDLAQRTAARNEQLFKDNGAITQADVDTSRSALRAAQAAVDASTANQAAAAAAVNSAEAAGKSAVAQATAAAANVAAAEAAGRDAQRQLGYATLTAPAAGRIGNKNVESGNRVSAGQELLALTEPAPWIVANFKETQLPRVAIGQPVEITVDALPGQTLHGKIDSLSPASGAQFALLPPDNATGNFNKVVQRVPVKIVLDPASAAQVSDRLRFGYSVIVNVRVR